MYREIFELDRKKGVPTRHVAIVKQALLEGAYPTLTQIADLLGNGVSHMCWLLTVILLVDAQSTPAYLRDSAVEVETPSSMTRMDFHFPPR